MLALCMRVQALEVGQIFLYLQTNLLVDKNEQEAEELMQRAAKAGYTAVLLADSKFAKLGDMDKRYFANIDRIKKAAADLHLDIVPTVFPIGYSDAILWHDPNLAEGLPVKDALFVVKNGAAHLQADPAVGLKGGDMNELRGWSWKDPTMVPDNGALRVTDPNGQNARVSQKVKLHPFRQYHLSVRVKAQDFHGQVQAKAIAGKRELNFAHLGVKPTQDWTTHHIIFNSLDNTDVQIYFGSWGGTTGSYWIDDAKLEEVGLVNLVRRDGAPLTVKRDDGTALTEGKDFDRIVDPRMGVTPWKGAFDTWHEAPAIKTSLPEGTRLRVSYYHAITVLDNQVMICPSEPKTIELLRDQAKRMQATWGAKGYMMSHDEIRVLNWCDACQRRKMDAGQILADNVKTCAKILREVNPGGKIYVWNDMFDPFHNAHNDYYLVRGDITGSWEGLDKDVIIMNWNFGKRDQSLKFFSDRGNQQVLAGYYDGKPQQILQWLDSAKKASGATGVMYTTWQHKFGDLEKFGELSKKYR